MSSADALIVFTPSGRRGRFPLGTPVLSAARSLGVDVDSVCGGRAMCGRCQVTVMEGDFSKHGVKSQSDHLSPVSVTETNYGKRRTLVADRRLSCQATIQGDVVIDVPASSQVHRQVIRKAADEREITLNPVVSLHYVEVVEPDMHNPASDLQRLCMALEREWQLVDLECDLLTGNVLATSGGMNPQIRFGEDLMSRVSYSMMHPEGAQQMTVAVRAALNELIAEVATTAAVVSGEILEAAFVGNPIMHHLLLGIDPVELGGAPFALCTDASVTVQASQLDLKLHPNARVYVLPCIAGHVGADTAGVILAERPDLRSELTLLVDVGTNAEIVLGNRDRLLACSSPTGPAFEGAQISGGQRAAPGAIERVRIDPNTLEPRYKIIGSDLWSDEPGFEAAAAVTGVTGICGSGIIEVVAEMYLAGIVSQDGVVIGSLAKRSKRVVPAGRTFSYVLLQGATTLQISQNDVRAIQLAKAALYAGIKLLMEHLGVEHVDRIRLAGAFGAHIDVKYAMVLGMIPDCDLAQVTSAGNAAGAGARIALLDNEARKEIERLVRRVEKIETAIEPRFQQHFVEAMAIPHKTAPYTKLREVVTLPAPVAAEQGDSTRPRGRRPTVTPT